MNNSRLEMYFLASDSFEKEILVCRKFLAFKYVSIVFIRYKSDDYLYLYTRNLENFETGFSVHNINLYFCWQVENTKWILCS